MLFLYLRILIPRTFYKFMLNKKNGKKKEKSQSSTLEEKKTKTKLLIILTYNLFQHVLTIIQPLKKAC